jgi:hypothetical protein
VHLLRKGFHLLVLELLLVSMRDPL